MGLASPALGVGAIEATGWFGYLRIPGRWVADQSPSPSLFSSSSHRGSGRTASHIGCVLRSTSGAPSSAASRSRRKAARCPHQGGPLGEGSIENGLLRCPWHGWDFHPATGKPPGGYDDGVKTYPVEIREDGVYVGFDAEAPHARTVSDVMAETMAAWGVKQVFGMVGHWNLGLADALRRLEENGKLSFYGVRHEGAASFAASAYGKLTGRPAACMSIAGPGATNLLTGLWDANVDRSPVLALTGQVDTQVLGPGAFQEVDLQAASARWRNGASRCCTRAGTLN